MDRPLVLRNDEQLRCVALTSCGKWGVFGGSFFLARYSIATQTRTAKSGFGRSVQALSFSVDERIVFAGVEGGGGYSVARVDAETLEKIGELRGPGGGVKNLALLKGMGCLLSGGEDGIIVVWSLRFNSQQRVLREHCHTVTGFAVLANEERLFSAGLDCAVVEWSTSKSSRINRYLHDEPVNALALSPDETLLFVGGGRRLVGIKIADFSRLFVVKAHTGPIRALAIVGGRLVSAGDDRCLRVCQLDAPSRYATLRYPAVVLQLAPWNEGQVLVAGQDSAVKICDLRELTLNDAPTPLHHFSSTRTGHTSRKDSYGVIRGVAMPHLLEIGFKEPLIRENAALKEKVAHLEKEVEDLKDTLGLMADETKRLREALLRAQKSPDLSTSLPPDLSTSLPPNSLPSRPSAPIPSKLSTPLPSKPSTPAPSKLSTDVPLKLPAPVSSNLSTPKPLNPSTPQTSEPTTPLRINPKRLESPDRMTRSTPLSSLKPFDCSLKGPKSKPVNPKVNRPNLSAIVSSKHLN